MSAGLLFCVLLLAAQESDPGVPLPPEISSAPLPDPLPSTPAVQEPVAPKAAVPILIPERKTEAPRISPLLADRPEAGPSLGGFMVSSIFVLVLLVGAFMLLKRYGRHSKLLGGGDAIRVLSRKTLGQKQEVFLVEVGPRVFLVGSTREHLSTLGEFSNPDEVAALRAELPAARGGVSERLSFRESLRDGLKAEEAPPKPEAAYASIADELAEIRKTVQAWRA